MGTRCPESGKATGRIDIPGRRLRCVVCWRLIRLQSEGQYGIVVVPKHDFPRMGPYSATNVLKRLI
jgi:hypothetical protein